METRLELENYNKKLAKRVEELIMYYIIPSNVLYVFPKYDADILSRRDIEEITCRTDTHGSTEGALLLLDRLSRKRNWFQCFLKVLRDWSVRQDHVARMMEKIKAELDKELSSFSEHNAKQEKVGAPPVNDINKEEVKFHGPEYDFKLEDVSAELSHVPGWHQLQDEREISKKLQPFISTDGHYILFYWKKKKRPALCVTDKKELKILLIHKVPDKQDESKTNLYFINKREMTSDNLCKVVEYHLKNGVKDTNEVRIIYFRHPVLP